MKDMRVRMRLANPALIFVHSFALLLVGCAIGVHWSKSLGTAVWITICAALLMGSSLGGTANSLEPISWSPNGRWLLVGFGNWYYASDAGLSILLYDRTKRKVISPYLSRLVTTALKKECSIRVDMPFRFDALSRVHLRLADEVDEGDKEPTTHCFQGQEEWVFDPGRGTLHSTSIH